MFLDYVIGVSICWIEAATGPLLSLALFYFLRKHVRINKVLQLLLMIIISLVAFFLLALARFSISKALSGQGAHYEEMLGPEVFSLFFLVFMMLSAVVAIFIVPIQSLPEFKFWRRKYRWLVVFAFIGLPVLAISGFGFVNAVDYGRDSLRCYKECEDLAATGGLAPGVDAASCKEMTCK